MNAGVSTLSLFPFLISWAPADGMVLPILGMGLLSSVKPLWKNLFNHAQRYVSGNSDFSQVDNEN